MANVLRIKRRLSGGAGPPASLKNAELAFNEADGILYYGAGDSGGNATSIKRIGGAYGAYLFNGGRTSPAVSGNVMAGFGSNWQITPNATGRVKVDACGSIQTTVTAGTPNAFLVYGSGSPPAAGGAFVGNIIGSGRLASTGTAGWAFPMAHTGILTGMTLGTTYWFDYLLQPGAGTQVTALNCDISAIEF